MELIVALKGVPAILSSYHNRAFGVELLQIKPEYQVFWFVDQMQPARQCLYLWYFPVVQKRRKLSYSSWVIVSWNANRFFNWTSTPTEFLAHAVVNSGGRSDARVLEQVLDKLSEMLYPKVVDDDDH
jgi:hypothetical protein